MTPESNRSRTEKEAESNGFRPEDWVALVERIRQGDPESMELLYQRFFRGIRLYLRRQIGCQEIDDKVHDTFLIVLQAIRRGEVKEPARLLGFIRTVVRRQVAAYIEAAIHERRDLEPVESNYSLSDRQESPEERLLREQRRQIMAKVLREISKRDREILTRFYLLEQTQEQICSEMHLTETQFRLLKSRAKARFGELGRRTLARRPLAAVLLRKAAGASH